MSSFQNFIEDLQNFDVNDVDFNNAGSWPLVGRVIVWVLLLVAVLFAGYYFHVSKLEEQLRRVEGKETELRGQFENKVHQAANLDAYRKQMEDMQESFGALLSQLPTDTEVPGLLEDITRKGLESGLTFNVIRLQPERNAEFYIELPIEIVVEGTYHDLGTFVSGVAGMPRIVTLHDFSIAPKGNSGLLTMNILAKTYRYKSKG